MKINTKSYTSEYLSKDILEKEFLKVFSYFNIVQKLLGSSRVDARDCFVSPPTLYQKIYTIMFCIVVSILNYVGVHIYVLKFSEVPYVAFMLKMSTVFSILVFMSNMIHVRFLNNEANVKFYIKMQEIDRTMGIGEHIVINKFSRLIYNVTILSLGTVCGILVMLFINLGSLLVGFIAYMCLNAAVVLESIYCINLSVYFILRLRFINSVIVNYMEPVQLVGKVTSINVRKRSIMRQLAARTHDFRSWDVDIHLKALFRCFKQYQNLYRFQVLLFFFNYVTTVTVSVEFVTIVLQNDVITVQDGFLNFILVLLSIFQSVSLCFCLEQFFSGVKETKCLCTRIMSICFNGPIRYKAKKTLQIIEVDAPTFKVYDVLEINAGTIPKVISLMTFLVVTLLQFTFL